MLSTWIAAITCGLAVGRVAADLALQLQQIGEHVGLPTEVGFGENSAWQRRISHRDSLRKKNRAGS
jgi:hypothetical protein